MNELTYLKKMERRDRIDWGWYIMTIIIAFTASLAIYFFGVSSGLKEGVSRTDAAVSKALAGGYRIGVEKGLEALECKKRGEEC